jgi:hypothetical protein
MIGTCIWMTLRSRLRPVRPVMRGRNKLPQTGGAKMQNDEEGEQKIRERAYLIWLSEGEPEGRDKEHWEMARIEIQGETGTPSNKESAERRLPPDDSL